MSADFCLFLVHCLNSWSPIMCTLNKLQCLLLKNYWCKYFLDLLKQIYSQDSSWSWWAGKPFGGRQKHLHEAVKTRRNIFFIPIFTVTLRCEAQLQCKNTACETDVYTNWNVPNSAHVHTHQKKKKKKCMQQHKSQGWRGLDEFNTEDSLNVSWIRSHSALGKHAGVCCLEKYINTGLKISWHVAKTKAQIGRLL